MAPFAEKRFREVMGQAENIRLVAVVGQHNHGRSSLVQQLQRSFGLEATGPGAIDIADHDARAGMDGRRRLQVATLLSDPSAQVEDSEPAKPANRLSDPDDAASVRKLMFVRQTSPRASNAQATTRPERASKMDAPAQPPLLVHLVDAPGHSDFAADVAVALRLADAVVIVVDATEACLVHTEVILQQALAERVRPILFVNGIDRCLTELKLSPAQLERRLRDIVNRLNEVIDARPDELVGDVTIRPEQGGLLFGNSSGGWAFSLPRFAEQRKGRLVMTAREIVRRLWAEDPDSASDSFLCTHLLGPFAQLLTSVLDEKIDVDPQVHEALGTTMEESDRQLEAHAMLESVLSRRMNVADVLFETLRNYAPSPREAQMYRVENLYCGPTDDEDAVAVRFCDSTGPMMTFLGRILPTISRSDENDRTQRLYAVGRVFSGTLRVAEPLRVHCTTSREGVDDTRVMRALRSIAVPLADALQVLEQAEVCCGNLVAVSGVEDFLRKEGTLMSTKTAAPLADLAIAPLARPVFRVAVQPDDPEDLPQLAEAVNLLGQIDPLVRCTVEEWGQYTVSGSGESHLGMCMRFLKAQLGALQLRFMTSPSGGVCHGTPTPAESAADQEDYRWQVSENAPCGVVYCETVNVVSSQAVDAEAPNKLCKFSTSAAPLDAELCSELEAGLLAQCAGHVQRARVLSERYRWTRSDDVRVWCFGFSACGPNAVVSDPSVGVDGACGDTGSKEPCAELRGAVDAAFRWVHREGGLCEEHVRGVRFRLQNARLDNGAVQRGAGQVVGAVRRCFLAAQLSAQASLQEPVLRAEFVCPTRDDTSAACEEVFAARGASIVSQQTHTWAHRLRILAELPAVSALSLDAALNKVAGANCALQMSFSHWAHVPGSPQEAGPHRNLVLRLRGWRQLDEFVPTPEHWLRPEAAVSPLAIFSDDLSDVAMPARRQSNTSRQSDVSC